jgi:multiple sugar transport system substrate-binding protein
MKRKFATALLCATALVATACSGAEPESPAAPENPEEVSGSVTMWYPPIGGDIERAYWDGQIEAFQEEYPDIDVSVEIIPWDSRSERLQTAIAGGTTPDVTYALPSDVYSWGDGGVLADMGDVVQDQDKYFENAIEAMTYDGTLYAAPALMGVLPTLYIKPVWDDMGVEPADYPKTWDEVKEWAPKLKEKGYFVTQYDAAPTMTLNGSFYPLLWGNGGRVLSEDLSTVEVNNEAGVGALEFAKWLVDGEHVPADALTQALPVETSPIAQGKVAMLFSRSIESLTQNGVAPEDLVVGAPLENVESKAYGNVAGWVMFEESENKDAAAVWINWINQPENLEGFLVDRNQQSARTDVTDLYEEGSLEAEVAKYLDRGTIEPASPNAGEIMNLLKPHLQAALLGQKDAQTALDDAAAEIETVINN